MKAKLEIDTGDSFEINVPDFLPRIISGWASSLGIKAGKDRLIFAYYVTTMGQEPLYKQTMPEKFTPCVEKLS